MTIEIAIRIFMFLLIVIQGLFTAIVWRDRRRDVINRALDKIERFEPADYAAFKSHTEQRLTDLSTLATRYEIHAAAGEVREERIARLHEDVRMVNDSVQSLGQTIARSIEALTRRMDDLLTHMASDTHKERNP